MSIKSNILAGAVGLAAVACLASPAAAQYGYPGYNNGAGVVGQIIGSVLGYGQYPYGNYGYGQSNYMSSQVAINQCARAAEARIGGGGYGGYRGGYGGYGGGYGGYNRGGYGGRVLGINSVEVRGYNRIKVVGVASSGRQYANPYGYGGYAYNSQYGVPDLKFVCNADQSGRVYDVRIKANDGVR